MKPFKLCVLFLVLLASVLGAFVGCGSPEGSWGTNATPTGAPGVASARPQADPLMQGDELWILGTSAVRERKYAGQGVRYEAERARRDAYLEQDTVEVPGCGHLETEDPLTKRKVPIPLEHTRVQGEVRGSIASVDVEQRFTNPFDRKIEAVYVFPLPDDSAVHDFVMKIGERTIRGIVREREEAEQIYDQARARGHVASLLTEERPNVFTQRVANLEPGCSIAISLRYFDLLPLVDGWYEFVFPMVVGPRFNPPGSLDGRDAGGPGSGIGAVPRGAQGRSGQGTEVSYLAPDERSGHDVELSLDLDAGTRIEAWECPTHRVEAEEPAAERLQVRLAQDDRIPNRDFVLRYRLQGAELRPALVTGTDERGRYFALTLHPPAELESLEREPIELVFVLDTSGSMKGQPLERCRDAMLRALSLLDERDRFQILRFSEQASGFAGSALPASPENLERARRYVRALDAGGGTQMLSGIRAALGAPRDPERQRIVAFLTDGYIGNETEILAEERRLLDSARVFGFGVGSSVNRYLLEALSREGRGASAYVGLADTAGDTMAAFLERLRRPALEEIRLEGPWVAGAELFPERVPDLFQGRPVTLVGRLPASASEQGWIEVVGRVQGRTLRIPVALEPERAPSTALPWIWARSRIAQLASHSLGADPEQAAELAAEIRSTALEYGLSSAYTAFLAVDTSRRTAGDHGVIVPVPVPVPEGVRYETTVAGPGD